MACGVKTWYTISTTILVILNMESLVLSAKPQVPCYFIFGDSLVDNGNNNLLVTSTKANYPPYGIDFRGGPTGRFTNGRNIADFIAELLGFDKYIPPFATAEGREIISGVNYGSGGAGIRNETGQQLGDVISFNRQLLNHEITISRMVHLLGSKKAAEKHLSKCLYHVGMGNNDYINNYLMPKYYRTSRLYSPDHYARVLIQQYSKQLRILYKFGARKVAVFGLGLIGFTPAEIEMSGVNGLARVVYINNAVQLFNGRLKLLVDDLNNDLKSAKFIYLNSTSVQSGDPSTVGIKVVDAPCCKTSELAQGQCIPGKVPCSNRREYYFWDSFHSTEIANKISASRAYRAQLSTDAYPTDIRHLVQL